MWAWVWVLLAVGAVVLLAWVGWRVVRSGIALMREAGRAAQVLGEASDRLSDVLAQAELNRVPVTATMYEDREVLRERRRVLREASWERRGARRAGQADLWREWVRTTWLERRQATRRGPQRNSG